MEMGLGYGYNRLIFNDLRKLLTFFKVMIEFFHYEIQIGLW